MKIGIIGCGTMGSGICQLASQSGEVRNVILIGRDESRLKQASETIQKRWQAAAAKGRLNDEQADLYYSKIKFSQNFNELDCDIIVESVSENMEAKLQIFDRISESCSKEAIIATNTSSLSVTALSRRVSNPSRFIGIHFFNPPQIMKLTEIISGALTSAETTEQACAFVEKLGKEPIRVNEAPGFVVNRMLIPMINEAIGILAEGVACAGDIDKAMQLGANHPIGPLALADLIGLDVNLSIMDTLHQETGDPKYRAHPLLRKMVRAQHLGRKTGQGFFYY